MSCEFIIAALLITSDPTVVEPLPVQPAVIRGGVEQILVMPKSDAAWAELLRPNLLALAIDAEILDPREKGFVMGQDVLGDLAMLRGRWQEFYAAPALADGERFPERKTINEFLALNRSYRNQLTQRLSIDLIFAAELRTAIEETDQLYQVWDTVRDGRCDYYYVTVRRQALSLLRDLIGHEAYYSGQLPPHVPVWHFPRERRPTQEPKRELPDWLRDALRAR